MSIYNDVINYSGPYEIDNLKIYVVNDGEFTYSFHRESASWLKIKTNKNSVDWDSYLELNKCKFKKYFEIKQDIAKLHPQYSPQALILFPTETCNLRCLYCHCDSTVGKNMSTDIAIKAIDGYLNQFTYGTRAHLGFSGGGEPTVNMPIIKAAVTHFNRSCASRGLRSTTNIVTNACCSKDSAKWLLESMDHITVSFDGLPDLQDMQRPLSGGGSSWTYISNFMDLAVNYNKSIAVRVSLSLIILVKCLI